MTQVFEKSGSKQKALCNVECNIRGYFILSASAIVIYLTEEYLKKL